VSVVDAPTQTETAGPVWVVVVAAGSGRRFGGAKQYEPLGDRRVLDWSLEAARSCADGVVLVVGGDAPTDEPADRVVRGGATRSDSVRSGLAAVPADAPIVLVHDAARPLASPRLFEAVIDAVRSGSAAVVPGLAPVDTLRHRAGGVVDRSALVAVQTPQGFRTDVLRAAHATGAEATDDAGLVEAAGHPITVIDGEAANRKITTADDLVVAATLVSQGRAGSESMVER
jgi:2-C-methyl-D-erythritol 4-phosphate cytidylyltransferase